MALFHSPSFLLLLVGGVLGLNFPLGKLAMAAGVPALGWAMLVSASAGVLLTVLCIVRSLAPRLDRRHVIYFLIAAFISYALPNALLFAAIPRLGSGFTAMIYTISPLITVVLAALAGLRRPHRLELIGIGIGFIGALMVVSGRGEIDRPASLLWLGVALLVPLSLALGNVYRTLAWPEGSPAIWLGAGCNVAAALMLLGLLIATGEAGAMVHVLAVPWVALAQVLASALMFGFYFRLQLLAGPVTLSQIGVVAAGVGICIGAGLLGERYPLIVWAGVGVIALGIGCTIAARRIAAMT